MTAKSEEGLDENYLQAAVAVVGSARTDKPIEQRQEQEARRSDGAVLGDATNKAPEDQTGPSPMEVDDGAADPSTAGKEGPSKIETFPVSDVVGIVRPIRSEARGGGGGGAGSKETFKVKDLVEIVFDAASTTVYGKSGVVRITKVNRDGTYDGVYVLDNSKMSRMPGHLLKRSELMAEGPEATSGRRGRSARARRPTQKLTEDAAGAGGREAAEAAQAEAEAMDADEEEDDSRAPMPTPGKKEKLAADAPIHKVLNRLDKQDKYGYFRNEDAWTPRPGYSGPCTLADIRDRVEEDVYFRTQWHSWITGEEVPESCSSATEEVSVEWDLLLADLQAMFGEALEVAQSDPEANLEERGGLGHAAKLCLTTANAEIDKAKKAKPTKQVTEPRKRERLKELYDSSLHVKEWRQQPYPLRQYERIESYVPAKAIYSQHEADSFLATHLDGFLGQPYNYDDSELSDSWMATLAGDDQVASLGSSHQQEWVQAQVMSVISRITRQIQDRCHNNSGTLSRPKKIVGQHVAERPVWGIDGCTRRLLDLALDLSPLHTDAQKAHFVEKRLLPTVNTQEPLKAHDMRHSLAAIEAQGRPAEGQACAAIRKAIDYLGLEHFKIHPKGTGAICIQPEGIRPYEFVTEYLGELYPAWRWFEKEEAVQDAVRELDLKPSLPDFYNIMLERPRNDDRGYGIAFVDASRRANMGSSLSHSCNANCYTEVVGRRGQLTIALVTDREIAYGEELCMDYCSYTDNYNEFLSAVCLCGSTHCRQSFLHHAGYNMFHKVLERNYGPARRFTHLLFAGIAKSLSRKDRETLIKHGIKKAAFEGDEMPVWLARYVAEVLRFVEFERRVLPFKLIESNSEPGMLMPYTMASADESARSVMENRVQSLVQVLCIVHHILARQPHHMLTGLDDQQQPSFGPQHAPPPLRRLEPQEVLAFLWNGPDSLPKRVHAAAARHGLSYTRSLGDTPAMTNKKAEVSRLLKEMARLATSVTVVSRDEARDRLLELRAILKDLDKIQGYRSRHLAAADMVLFWAHTDTLVQLHPFAPVSSPPIEVQARDLGQPVPRATVMSKKSRRSMVPTVVQQAPLTHASLPGLGPSPYYAPPAMPAMAPQLSQGGAGAWPKAGPSSSEAAASADKAGPMCAPDEVVHVFTPRHESDAITNQLLQWFNLNVQENSKVPELMGCCLLPAIEQVYAVDEVYGKKERMLLYEHLENKFSRMSAFPKALRKALVGDRPLVPRGQAPTFGSPLLDFELNYGWPLGYVQDELERELDIMTPKRQEELNLWKQQQAAQAAGAKLKLPPGKRAVRVVGPPVKAGDAPPPAEPAKKKSPQKGEELPPAPPATWVQCEDPECLKWRRLPWFVDAADLPTPFYCRLNTWRPSEANCNVPEEQWNDEFEATISMSGTDFSGLKPGDWVDTLCEHNSEWYESRVVEREGNRVLIHFHKWSKEYDEWIDISANRFAPHMSYSKVTQDYVNRAKRARRRAREEAGDYETDEDDEEDDEEEQQEEEDDDEDWSATGGRRSSRRRRRKPGVAQEQEENKQAAKRARQQQPPAMGGGSGVSVLSIDEV